MPEYLTPGVYLEETSFRSKSIEGVATATLGMTGLARYGPVPYSVTLPSGDLFMLPSPTLVPEAVFTYYDGWKREQPPRRRKGPRPVGVVMVRPTAAPIRRAARA